MAGKFKEWLKDKMTDDKGLFQGGSSGKIFGRIRDNNMIKRNANKVRDNSNFFMYDEDPEMYDSLGEAGIKFKTKPGWFSNRPHTFGNTVYVPRNTPSRYERENELHGYNYANNSEWLAYEEVPHLAQWRNEGLLGFGMDYLNQLSKHGQAHMYEVGNSMEGFHHHNDAMKMNLLNQVWPNHDPDVNYTGDGGGSWSKEYEDPHYETGIYDNSQFWDDGHNH
jgi:hypothetical protein